MRENVYITRKNIAHRWKNETLKKRARKIKYRVGDLIRISRAKGAFEKEYDYVSAALQFPIGSQDRHAT